MFARRPLNDPGNNPSVRIGILRRQGERFQQTAENLHRQAAAAPPEGPHRHDRRQRLTRLADAHDHLSHPFDAAADKLRKPP